MKKSEQSWLEQAKKYEPEGITCGWCGKENDFADDCGFFYCTPEGNDTRPTCEKCYHDVKVGGKHINRYGLGER